MHISRIATALFILACLIGLSIQPVPAQSYPDELDISDVQWRLSLNNTLIQSAGLPFGAEFVIDADQVDASTAGILLDALDGITFTLEQAPSNAKITIAINLNVQGDGFMPVPKGLCCFNASFETTVDGLSTDSGSMLAQMTIPSGAGLDNLLDLCGVSRDDVVFASYSGGSVTASHVETVNQVMGLTARFFPDGMLICGKGTDFGMPASVEYSTWFKVKALFE